MLVALFASALLSSALFNLAANQLTENSSQEELLDKATSMASYLQDQITEGIEADDASRLQTIKNAGIGYRSYDVISCYYLLYDANGKLVSSTAADTTDTVSVISSINGFCASNMLTNSDNKNLIGSIDQEGSKNSITIVQVPIQYEGHIVAYLIIGDQVTSVTTTLSDFSQYVFLSTLVVSLAMLLPVYFASKRYGCC